MITLWRALGSLKLAFWLLIGATASLFTGSLYANQDYSFFSTLNETPLHIWLAAHIKSDFDIIWWLPVLFIFMTLLGFNIFVCALNRMIRLLKKRKKMAGNRFFVKLMPSIIHFLFLVIITGHFITFTLGSWQRTPLNIGETVYIGEKPVAMTVQSIKHQYFPEHSGLRGRVEQMQVVLTDERGRELPLSFLKPVSFDGTMLQLDMRPNKQKAVDQPPLQIDGKDINEYCNKAHIYHVQPQKADKQLTLLSINDPGLYLILWAFTAILILMTWYFVSVAAARSKAKHF
ncbi:MAG: hypothetical protein K9L30_07855 [Desulfobacterales bacterium]|nr:hypothetical protein [Desulfobacterales bacterium]